MENIGFDNTICTALIAAVSACIGALIPCLFSYLGKRQEYKNDRTAKIEEIRREEYRLYIETLQTMINEGNRDNFLALQKSTNRLLLFSGAELSKIINQYYRELIERTNQGNSLSQQEQIQYQTRIFNTMRKELGVDLKELEQIIMVRADF
ncbi:MAG: hypothetical protein IJZ31_08975 [Bacteroidaceae bacterium]|nr:hypothetical protein [Bacteroidaceae bacterium]